MSQLVIAAFKVPMKRNFFLHNSKVYYEKYTIPKFEDSTIKIVDFTSAESYAFLPSKMANEPRGQNTT